MIYVLKAAAAVLVLIVSRSVSAEYKKYAGERIALCEGFVLLLSFIKTELSCRGREVAEWAEEVEIPALAAAGFTEELRKTRNLHAAFSAAEEKMPRLDAESRKILEEYFASFGKSYREEEVARAHRAGDELSAVLTRERENTARSVRAVRILSYAIALGVIILIL